MAPQPDHLTAQNSSGNLSGMKTLHVLGAALGSVAIFACGSSDNANTPREENGGAGGEEQGNAGGSPEGGSPEGGSPAALGGAAAASGAAAGSPPEGESGAGGEGGSEEPLPGNDLYVSPTGSDEAAGTEADPFLTIAHAAGIAQENDRIHLLDGTFDSSTQPSFSTNAPISIPAGVTLMAENPGQALLVGTSPAASVALEFAGSGELRDVRFSAFRTAVRASAGRLAISGLSLENFSDPSASPLELSGSALVTLTPGGVESYVSNGFYFATLGDSATLLVDGGRFEAVSGTSNQRGVFNVRGDAELTLSGVAVIDTAGEVIFATDTAKVSLLEGTTIEGSLAPSYSNIELQGESELVMNDATLSDSYWAHISTIGAPTLSITNSTLTDAGSWALIINTDGAAGAVSVSIDGSVISNSNSVLGQIDVRRAADLIITDTQILDGTPSGIFLGDGAPVSLVLRDSIITGNGQSAVRISGHADSTCDLGTVDHPGGNTLLGNGTSQPALLSYLPAGKICYAVGNTWAPHVQDASAAGTYSVTGAGAKLDIVGLDNSGLNYWVMPAGSILRLAENP